ncbi:hypothetical protein [Pseudonocardia sp. Ae168_Ps1]|uniref:hypothetical protein n=1 Tax=Pseudonocardia sp. Ae168_Ps1 TaxID=1885029 RepID=UPI000A711427|nr:hypothetical protein [Pseudonocardia sp. Ae168_Ps1]
MSTIAAAAAFTMSAAATGVAPVPVISIIGLSGDVEEASEFRASSTVVPAASAAEVRMPCWSISRPYACPKLTSRRSPPGCSSVATTSADDRYVGGVRYV